MFTLDTFDTKISRNPKNALFLRGSLRRLWNDNYHTILGPLLVQLSLQEVKYQEHFVVLLLRYFLRTMHFKSFKNKLWRLVISFDFLVSPPAKIDDRVTKNAKLITRIKSYPQKPLNCCRRSIYCHFLTNNLGLTLGEEIPEARNAGTCFQKNCK